MDWERGIWFAASSGDEKRVESLISKSKNPREVVTAVDNSGYTALHYAARNGYLEICQCLVKNGAIIDAVTKSGKATPLQRAATAGKIDVVVYLIEAGANPLLQDADGKTALHRAVESGNLPIIQKLVQACPELLEMKDSKGCIMKDIIPELKMKL
ncbi:Ankyrin repeat domain-containing protein 39 [Eumeta japonica]|uniref:Ankyrin repeat domain-containing protein 39 n=1 Tax=Eumeta variegata TaxID=151549 RepID=A0A4C1UCU8_EUMVA|nr:Ankyrin repeat domain-containing protein 39 [Eumeta japonica]